MNNDELDEKIYGLAVKYYYDEQVENRGEYHRRIERGYKWAQDHIFSSLEMLSNESDEAYARDFREMFSQFDGGSAIRRFPRDNVRVLKIRGDFLRGVKYLIESSDDLNTKIDNLVNGSYRVSNLGLPVWSYLASAKFPDALIVNSRVQVFFSNLNINLGKTASEQVETVRKYYNHWVEFIKERGNIELDYIDLNHMIWFSQTKTEGQQYMYDNFGLSSSDPINQ